MSTIESIYGRNIEIHKPFEICMNYGTPEGTFPFRYLSEKKLKQGY